MFEVNVKNVMEEEKEKEKKEHSLDLGTGVLIGY